MRNTSESPFEYLVEIEINDQQLIYMFHDFRTLNYLGHADIYRKSINLLLKEYVRFSVQFHKYERTVKKEELSDAEERKDNDCVATFIINTNSANTAYNHLHNASDSSADCSSNRWSRSVKRRLNQMM